MVLKKECRTYRFIYRDFVFPIKEDNKKIFKTDFYQKMPDLEYLKIYIYLEFFFSKGY